MNANELREATAAHVESMDAAVRAAGIVPEEPLAPVLAEWRRSLAWSGELTARMAEISEFIDARLSAASANGGLGTIDQAVLVRLEEAAVDGASRRAGQLARMHLWRSGVIAGAVLMGVGALSAIGGYLSGRSSAVATVSAVQAAAVRDGPDAAAMWAQLMASNDGRLVAQTCKETGARSDGGRRACVLGVWVEPPVNPGPRTGPTK